MAYAPPSGSSVDFNLSGAYTPPAGGAVNFGTGVFTVSFSPDGLIHSHSLESTSITQGVPVWLYPSGISHDHMLGNASISMTHELTPESLIHTHILKDGFVFEGFVPDSVFNEQKLDSGSISQTHVLKPESVRTPHMLQASEISLQPDYVLPSRITNGISIKYRKAKAVGTEVTIKSRDAKAVDAVAGVAWGMAMPAEAVVFSGWEQMKELDSETAVQWGPASRIDKTIKSDFCQLPEVDASLTASWGSCEKIDREIVSGYLNPPPVQNFLESGWSTYKSRDKEIDCPYLNPPPVDVHHKTMWGKKYYERICVRKYYPPPGDQVDFNIHHPIELTGDGNHADFFFDEYSYDERCTQREPSGWRENYTYKRPRKIPRPPVLGVYIVLTNAMLCRLPDRTPIEVLSMSLSSKIDSWCWDFKAVLGSASDLAIVKSTDGSPVPVEVEINGWKWVVMIEDSDGSRQFPKGSWSVSGRSLSAELASPYAPIKTYTESNQRLARQLAEAELENTGWTFNWKIEDWLVPGNVFSVSNQTPMETILKIVRAAGGEIQSHRTEKILKAVSRYPKSPWSWATETPVISLHESVIMTLGWSNERRPGYNGIYVSGSTAGGVTVFVKRNGTAGEAQAGMIVDPLITAVEAGKERGRVELCKAGKWRRQRLSLPLMAGTELPGLMNCGDLIEVQEGSVLWRGQVSDVTINANRQNGLKVYQNIEVERSHG